MATRKIRIQSPLDRLPDGLKANLVAWLTTGGPDGVGMTYTAVRKKLRDDYGIRTSEASLCAFLQRQPKATEPSPIQAPAGRTITISITT